MTTGLRLLAATGLGLSLTSSAARAAAQASPLPDSFVVGAWTFRPTLEVRVRGEYRLHPSDVGGDVYDPTAVLAEDYQSALPKVTATQPAITNQYFVTERARLGLAVDRGPVTAAVTLQDARVWGDAGVASLVAPGEPVPSVLAPNEAYLEVHTRAGRRVFLRVGRQQVTWGDGRLVGANDWSVTGRSLDAARFGAQAGDFDVEALAAMLATPGQYDAANAGTTTATVAEGSGAQLYGLNAVWHALPLLNVEATGLARIVRNPTPSTLTPSNTFVADGRITGDRRGFRYALEGAYEGGQVASYGDTRKLRAFALAARASWETALPAHLTFSGEAAYASGDTNESGTFKGTITRFDPILPDEHTLLSPMSLVAWSNLILGGGSIGVRPLEELGLLAGYRYAALAEPGGRWSSAALYPVGAAPSNTARSLGHEIDAAIRVTPWKAFEVETGYGLFLPGAGADEILKQALRSTSPQHWAYLQTTVRVP